MRRIILLIIVVMGLVGTPAMAERALLAVATNFAETAEILAEEFEKESGHQIEFSFGATGKIYAQILRGAPFDAFLAADQYRPKLLHEDGLGAAPFTYAGGVLVWWPDRQDAEIEGKFAIANPELAPYGLAAKEVLEALNLWGPWQERLVMGENIGQTFAMVATGNAKGGLVPLSSVKSPRNTKDWAWSIASGHGPIRQDAILLNRGLKNAAATGFLTYLKGEKASRIIEAAGYEMTHHD